MLENYEKNKNINYKIFPDKNGRFGKFGGRFVAETLMPLLLTVEEEYKKAKNSKKFKSKLKYYFENYIGRPSLFILLKDYLASLMEPNYILKEMNLIILEPIKLIIV